MRKGDRIVIIGAGPGGLATALLLARAGLRVTVLERQPHAGGRTTTLSASGFRFDLGPTFFLYPQVLESIFEAIGRDLWHEVELIRLDPQWRSFSTTARSSTCTRTSTTMSAVLEDFSPGTDASQGYRRFLDLSRRLEEISQRFFFWRPVGSPRDMFDLRTSFQPSLLRAILDMRPGRSVSATVREHVSDARVAQMLDHFTQYVGSAPDQSPAVLCGIAHMQTNEGVWYPRGGTGAVPQALERLAKQLGVEVRLGVGVRRILLDSKRRVRGLQTDDGEQVAVTAVVANSDSVRTHRDLIGGEPQRRFERRRRYEPACSGVVLYLGLDHSYEHLAHHNFVFSRDPEEEFDAIYRKGEPAPDPTCYLAAPARSEPAVAPAGGEALYVLVHTPYLRPHHDWKRLFPVYRRTILDKLARTAGLDGLERRIRFESWLTPQDIHDRYGVLNGAIYGLASHGKLLGAFKPSNRSPDVAGLYFAGGSAHPGPGMPMVLMSGWIAADALDRDGQVARAAAGHDTRQPAVA